MKANFVVNEYKVILDVNDGESLKKNEYLIYYDDEFTLPIPQKVGHTFVGWYDGEKQITSTNGKSKTKWIYTENKIFNAKWDINTYSFSIRQNNLKCGTIFCLDSGIYEYGTKG